MANFDWERLANTHLALGSKGTQQMDSSLSMSEEEMRSSSSLKKDKSLPMSYFEVKLQYKFCLEPSYGLDMTGLD